MRRESVKAVLNRAKIDLKKIKRKYEKCMSGKKIENDLRIDIKNFMDNLRSTLDYIANDIYELIIKPNLDKKGLKTKLKIYFPHGEDVTSFKKSIKQNLPEIGSLRTDIFSLIESIQPYKCNNRWLIELCYSVNKNKHDSLSRQIKKEIDLCELEQEKNKSVKKEMIKPPFDAIRITWDKGKVKSMTGVNFLFCGTEIKVIVLLTRSLEMLKSFSDKFYTLII